MLLFRTRDWSKEAENRPVLNGRTERANWNCLLATQLVLIHEVASYVPI